jgi:hypothetical protein
MVKLEFKLALRYAACATNKALLQIYALHVGFDNLHVTKNSPERIHNVTRIKISGCDFMQHWRKENEILATDQRHLYVRSTREPLVEVHCCVKPGEPTTGNDYSSRLHAIIPNRNATRETKILLIDAIVQSFSHLFLKLAALEISLNFAHLPAIHRQLGEPVILCQSLAFSDRFFHHLPRSH